MDLSLSLYIYIYISCYTFACAQRAGTMSSTISRPTVATRLQTSPAQDDMFITPNFIPRFSIILHRDPMRSSNIFHWRPWIRDISYHEPFGEEHINTNIYRVRTKVVLVKVVS